MKRLSLALIVALLRTLSVLPYKFVARLGIVIGTLLYALPGRRKHIEQKGFPPAIRDICEAFSISSPNGVMCHLKALQKKGHINRVEKRDNKQRARSNAARVA